MIFNPVTCATGKDLASLTEALNTLTYNLASAGTRIAAAAQAHSSLDASSASLGALYVTKKAFADELMAAITQNRSLADLAVSQLENSIAGFALLGSDSNTSGYTGTVTAMAELRDALVAWYASYASTAATVSDLEDANVITHLLSGWGDVHGQVKVLSSAYTDSSGDSVGDTVIRWKTSSNSNSYQWTASDTSLGANAQTLYTPGSALAGARVTSATIYERTTSPYIQADGTELSWALYMPPEIRSGLYSKYAFLAHGSTGGHRWQYRNAAGAWVTLAELGLNTGTNFLAPSQVEATLSLPSYDEASDPVNVNVTLNFLRTSYGGYLKIEPVGPNYPASDILYYVPLRVLITNTGTATGHRPIVNHVSELASYATKSGNVVYVNDTNAQYVWSGSTWTIDNLANVVDVVTFSGFGIIRHQCKFS